MYLGYPNSYSTIVVTSLPTQTKEWIPTIIKSSFHYIIIKSRSIVSNTLPTNENHTLLQLFFIVVTFSKIYAYDIIDKSPQQHFECKCCWFKVVDTIIDENTIYVCP